MNRHADVKPSSTGLPSVCTAAAAAAEDFRHNDHTTHSQKWFSLVFIATALALLGLGIARLVAQTTIPSPAVVALVLVGWLLADFLSGLLHWAADTWGRVDMPVLGRRLLHPFRVHHVNPHDILGRGFLDLNGDVAAVCLPFLAFALWLPLEHSHTQALSLLLTAAAGFALPTNQIHQWAHMPRPPRWVRWLQAGRLVLTHRGHARHHANPAGGHYCITTGWCNAALTAAGFYVALERFVTATTGCRPRSDPCTAFSLQVAQPREAQTRKTVALRQDQD
ncbi:MAG TPA: fatty acid desaturase CarF family protein [Xanthomonadaceae bacterium]|nr:fatty acid desaturase CarF family protein [Xanthomonadaceae bacterium]